MSAAANIADASFLRWYRPPATTQVFGGRIWGTPRTVERAAARTRLSDPTAHTMSAEEETKPVRRLAPDIRGDPPASDRRPRASAKIWRLQRSFFPLDLVATRATSSASPRPALTPDAPRVFPNRPRRRRRRLPPRPSSASAQPAASAPRPPSIPAPSRPPPRLRPRAATTTTTPPQPQPPRPSARPSSFPSSSLSRSRPRAARRTRTSSSRPSPRRTDSPRVNGRSAASVPSSSCRTRTARRSAC